MMTGAEYRAAHAALVDRTEGAACSGCLRCYMTNGVHSYDAGCPDCRGTGCQHDHAEDIDAAWGRPSLTPDERAKLKAILDDPYFGGLAVAAVAGSLRILLAQTEPLDVREAS